MVPFSLEGGRWPRWRRDGRELYCVSGRNLVMAAEIHEKGESLEIGRATPLFPFRPAMRFFRQGMIEYDASPDGNRFLLNAAADENTRPLTLVVNWNEGLNGK